MTSLNEFKNIKVAVGSKTKPTVERLDQVPYMGEPSKSALQKVVGKIRLSNERTLTDPCAGDNHAANICWCDCSCACETSCSCSCSSR